MNKHEGEVLRYISSRSIHAHKYYQKYVDEYKKEHNCKSQLEAMDGLDIEIDKFIEKYFYKSNAKDFLWFLQEIKDIYLKHISDDRKEYLNFITDFYDGWLDGFDEECFYKKFKGDNVLFGYIRNELGEASNEGVRSEIIISALHSLYHMHKGLSYEEYGKLVEGKFKNTEGYEGIYRWYGEFLD